MVSFLHIFHVVRLVFPVDIVAQLVAMLDRRKHATSVVGSNPTPWTIFQQAVSKDHVSDLSKLKIEPKTVLEADVSPP